MTSSSVRTFIEPDEYAAAVRQGTHELTITERGNFEAKLWRIDLPTLWMQRFSEALARTSHVDDWGGRAVIAFRNEPGPSLMRDGAEVGTGRISWVRPGQDYYHYSTGPADYAGMSLPLEQLALIPDSPDEVASGQLRAPIPFVISIPYAGSGSQILTDPTGESRTRQFRQRFCGFRPSRCNPSGESGLIGPAILGREPKVPTEAWTIVPSPDAMARLQRLHAAATTLAEDVPQVLAHPQASRGLEQALIEAIINCLGGGETREDGAAYRQHAVIMRRFYRVIDEHLNQPLYLPELCREIGASERTLRACCHEHLGMGPKRYLLLRRMHLVRRALREGVPGGTTVTEIATRYGF